MRFTPACCNVVKKRSADFLVKPIVNIFVLNFGNLAWGAIARISYPLALDVVRALDGFGSAAEQVLTLYAGKFQKTLFHLGLALNLPVV